MASIVALTLGTLAAPPTGAMTLKVQPDSALAFGPPYYASVLAANTAATLGDSIAVSNSGSPYVQTVPLDLKDGVTYRGGFGPHFEGPNAALYETVLGCQPPSDSTDVSAVNAGSTGPTTVLAGFTITGGQAQFSGGGVFCGPGCSAVIRNCRIVGNRSVGTGGVGGGIAVAAGASPYIHDCELRGNFATLRGGAISIALNSGSTRIEHCVAVACSAAVGGQSSGGGGAIFSSSPIQLTRCEIDSCYSGYRGGGLLANSVSMYCAANQFLDCFAQQSGGAAYHTQGGGQHLTSSFEHCTAATGNGGALMFDGGTWLVQGCFIRDCTAAGRGGGVYYQSPTGAQLRLTEVVQNTATRGGGVGILGSLFRTPLSVSVESCTIALNTATATAPACAGGGIHVFPEGNYADAIVNCIVARQVKGSCIATEGALNQPNIRFDCVWNDVSNSDPAYGCSCADRTGINGNISANPFFCNTGGPPPLPPQLTLTLVSPCRGTGEGGIDMGAHPGAAACTVVAVEPATWGKIKAYFR